jgi:hypothetical protein
MARKLTLDLDALSVSSFATVEKEAEMRGTVNGNAKIPCPWSQIGSCAATVHTCASFDRGCLE